MSPSSAHKWSAEAIATGDLDKIQASMAVAGDRVNDARRHIRSARTLADDDPTLAMAACHDAIRKAITGHMAAFGLRPRAGEGAHRIVLEYARQELADLIDTETLDEADDIRRDRGLAEYGNFASKQLDPDHVRWAADVAERIVGAIAQTLAARAKRSPPRR